MNGQPWRAIGLSYAALSNGGGERRILGWECATCGLVVGGRPIAAPPLACPVCAIRDGREGTFAARLSDAGPHRAL